MELKKRRKNIEQGSKKQDSAFAIRRLTWATQLRTTNVFDQLYFPETNHVIQLKDVQIPEINS